MANFLDVLATPCIQNIVLQHLGVRDAKALRLTCQKTRDLVDKSPAKVKRHWGGVSATIDLKNETGKSLTFDSLTALPFDVNELILLNYSSPKLLNAKVTGDFLKEKGAGVKSLRMEVFFGCRFKDELRFLEDLSGLQQLTVDYLDVNTTFGALQDKSTRLPDTIFNLRTLDVKADFCITWCSRDVLKILSAPRFTTVLKLPAIGNQTPVEYLEKTLQLLQQRQSLKYVNKTNYTHVDLSGFPNRLTETSYRNEMRQLLANCRSNSVRLLNVSPILLVEYESPFSPWIFLEGTRDTVQSFVGWHWSLKGLHSTTLQELRIPSTSRADKRNGIPEAVEINETYCWPNLKLLHVYFDTPKDDIVGMTRCVDLIRALHLGPVRVPQSEYNSTGFKLAELEVTFHRGHQNGKSLTPPGVLCPTAIALHFPNLSILKIDGWDALDDAWAALWKGLHRLEEVLIDDCRNLGDFGFIGFSSKPSDPPVFLKFNRLKKLTLKLSDTSKITDNLFRDVISHLSLAEFYLHTSQPSRTLSQQALESLADGSFGRSVKKFPFDTFALKNTSHKELQNLKFRFPSAHF